MNVLLVLWKTFLEFVASSDQASLMYFVDGS